MNEFTILTNRKRAVIALIHSIVFLGVAVHGFIAPKAGLLHGTPAASDFVLVMIYMTVTSILAWLLGISRGAKERLYFAFCTSSASFGLLRMIFGDATLPAAQYLRVAMLGSAVVVGTWIVHAFSRAVTEKAV